MSYDTELAALLSEPWNESVCRGYTILALERCGYKTAVIQRVMSELHELLDFTSPQEAQAYYEQSPYSFSLSFDKAQGRHPKRGGGLARSRIGQTIQRIYLAERRRMVYARTD